MPSGRTIFWISLGLRCLLRRALSKSLWRLATGRKPVQEKAVETPSISASQCPPQRNHPKALITSCRSPQWYEDVRQGVNSIIVQSHCRAADDGAAQDRAGLGCWAGLGRNSWQAKQSQCPNPTGYQRRQCAIPTSKHVSYVATINVQLAHGYLCRFLNKKKVPAFAKASNFNLHVPLFRLFDKWMIGVPGASMYRSLFEPPKNSRNMQTGLIRVFHVSSS